MDTGSSGEDVVVKPRKPYTITKQRERWTEEEHNRFLEALKLYGRAWQKIEEHIGTKTAVQIRSHAQKFFTKLEKEASAKGIPLGQKLDIEIPPPRPKRKPSNPYPRKQCINSSPTSKEGKGETSSVSNCSSCPSKELNNFKKPISLEKLHRDQIIETSKKVHENGKYAEVLTLFQDTPCTSLNSVKDGSGNSLVFWELVPLLNEFKGDFLDNKRYSTDQEEDEPKQSCTLHTMVNDKLKDVSADLNPRAERADPSDILDKSKKVGVSIQNQQPGLQKSPGTSCLILQDNTDDGGHSQPSFCHLQNPTSLPDVQSQMHTNPFMNSSMFARPDFHPNAPNPPISQQLPSFPSVGQFNCNQDAYRSLLNMSSTFSNLVVSTLLQNPAAHAAATLAASLWHSFDTDKSKGSSLEVSNGNITSSQVSGHLSSPPSVAAIAAATVAAATAWWAMHGLVPFFHPVPNCYAFASASPPDLMTSPAADRKPDNIVDCIQIVAKQGVQPRDEESPDAQAVQGPMSKSLSSSDSDGTGGAEMSHVTQLKSSEVKELVLTTDTGLQESSSNMRIKSKPGHYFCGSVTVRHSSFEIEKAGTSKEQLDESQLTPRVSEAKARRSRSSGSCVNESRKVSEEGRLAFQALFSREVLPQTFSPPSEDDDLVHCDRGVDMAFSVDLNRKVSTDTEPDMMICQNGPALRNNDRVDSSFSTNGVSHSKLKVRKAGFKPYKRCSVEANVSRITGEEEKANKRAHMESKASN